MSVLAVMVGLYITNAANRASEAANRAQQQIDEQGQVTGRFTAAIDQLGQEGTDKLDIRLGGIYTLDRLMRDSPGDEPSIIAILIAFLNTHAAQLTSEPKSPSAPDVIGALQVLAERPHPDPNSETANLGATIYIEQVRLRGAHLASVRMPHSILSGSDLSGSDLSGSDLSSTRLNDANLTGADLGGSDLGGSILFNTDLSGANLRDSIMENAKLVGATLRNADMSPAGMAGADMTAANLVDANLSFAYLADANLHDAFLTHANLTRANLNGANLTHADLFLANLTGTDLTGVDLTGADLRYATGLTPQQLGCAKQANRARLPDGVAIGVCQ